MSRLMFSSTYDVFGAAVAEVHALELDVAAQIGQRDARGQVFRLLFGLEVEHVAQALHRDGGVVQQAPQPDQAHQRREHAAHQGVEGDQLADGQLASQHQAGAGPEDGDRGGGVQQLPGQADPDVERLRAVLHLERLGVLLLPLQPHRPLDAHALDGLHAAERFHQVRLGVGGGAEHLARIGLDLGGHQHRQRQDRDHERDQQQRELHVVEEHHREVDEDHQQVQHRGDGRSR